MTPGNWLLNAAKCKREYFLGSSIVEISRSGLLSSHV